MSTQQGGKILLLRGQTRLLVRQSSLLPRLLVGQKRLLLCLLVSKLRLHPGLSAESLGLQGRREVLLANGKTCLLVGELCLQLPLCVGLVRLLSLLIRRLKTLRLNVAFLQCKVASGLCFHNRLPGTTKSASTDSLRTTLSPGDICLSLGFAGLDVHYVLHVGGHIGFGGAGLSKRPSHGPLGGAHRILL